MQKETHSRKSETTSSTRIDIFTVEAKTNMRTKFLSVLGAMSVLLSGLQAPAILHAEGDAPVVALAPAADPEPCGDRCPDLGDAPDSNNSLGNVMSIHPFGLVAQPAFYPTEYTAVAGSGPVHWNAGSNPNFPGIPGNAIDSALGLNVLQNTPFSRVSNERNAFLLPDQDARRRNIIPAPLPVNGRSNRDGFDNAFVGPAGNRLPMQLAPCKPGAIRYAQYIHPPWSMNAFYAGPRYINVWVDLNRDGDWADTLAAPCPDKPAATNSEWLVQNLTAPAASGVYTLPVNIANIVNLTSTTPLWLRISISDSPAPANSIGNGPAAGYRFGETEDHLMCYRPALDVWTNCPSVRVHVNDDEVDGEFRIDAGRDSNGFTKPITITDDIIDDAVYPVDVTWTIDAENVRVVNPSTSAQSVEAADGRLVIKYTIPSANSPMQPVVLGWYGCITCTVMSAATASTPATGVALPPPGAANLRMVDASGFEMSEDFVVNIGWRTFVPVVLRKPEE
jgi:hypothetical protein